MHWLAVDDEADADAGADCDVRARRALVAQPLHVEELGERRRVHVRVELAWRRWANGAKRAKHVRVLPAGLGRRRDVAERRTVRVQVDRPKRGHAQRIVGPRAKPLAALSERLRRRGRGKLGTLHNVGGLVVRDGDHEGRAAALDGSELEHHFGKCCGGRRRSSSWGDSYAIGASLVAKHYARASSADHESNLSAALGASRTFSRSKRLSFFFHFSNGQSPSSASRAWR